MAEVVKHEGGEPTMSQLSFAIIRGQAFERSLFENDAREIREDLAKARVLPKPEAAFRDFRLHINGGPCGDQDDAKAQTAQWLRQIAEGTSLPVVAAGATISIPGGVMLPEAMLVLEAIGICFHSAAAPPRPWLSAGVAGGLTSSVTVSDIPSGVRVSDKTGREPTLRLRLRLDSFLVCGARPSNSVGVAAVEECPSASLEPATQRDRTP